MLRGKKWKKLANTLSAPSLPLPQKKAERKKKKKKNWKRIFNALKKAVWERCKKKDICDKPGWYCLDWPGARGILTLSGAHVLLILHKQYSFLLEFHSYSFCCSYHRCCCCNLFLLYPNAGNFFVPLFFLRRGAYLRTSLELSELSR